jgi:hypothetical protein
MDIGQTTTTVRGFENSNCGGGGVKTAFASRQCHAMRKPRYKYNIWSIRVEC